MAESIKFKDLGKIEVPEKSDVKEAKITSDVEQKIQREGIEQKVREETGTLPEKKGSLTKDVPQLIFRLCASGIDCKKFELSDDEAEIFAKNLNVLIPLDGKIAALVVLIMITVNKVLLCMDAIKAKFGTKEIDAGIPAPKAEAIK